jgi:hypothetical protein
MRPAEVTEEVLVEWRKNLQEFLEAEREAGVNHFRPMPEEAWFCGQYIYEKLRSEGCELELAQKVAFGNGQKTAMCGSDYEMMWVKTIESLENWRRGKPDMPGPELAHRLMVERYGAVNRETLLQYMRDTGVNKTFQDKINSYKERIPPGTSDADSIAMMKKWFEEDYGKVPMTKEEFDKEELWKKET